MENPYKILRCVSYVEKLDILRKIALKLLIKRPKTSVLAKLNVAKTKVAARDNLIQGLIPIYDTPALLLFDLGYTYSYMSYRLLR